MGHNDVDVAIIGGGVIGCAVAWELSSEPLDIFLFEKNLGITKGENQSSRNSGVVHSGIYYDQETRPKKAALCVEGNPLLYAFCERYQVPALQAGKMIVATSEEEEETLDVYLARAEENGVPGVKKISGKVVTRREPNVVATSALDVPSAGIVDAPSLVYRLHALAARNGVYFLAENEVIHATGNSDHVQLVLSYRDGNTETVRAQVVVNAAGVDADRMAGLLNPDSPYERDPIKGESYKFYNDRRPELKMVGTNVYPTPEVVVTEHGRHFTVGVHLTPTFDDLTYPSRLGTTVTVGPKVVPAQGRRGEETERIAADFMANKVQSYFPGIKAADLHWHQAGVQARLKNHPDFIIDSDPSYPHFINLLGIDSPGLTASLAIGKHAARRVKELLR